MITEQRTSADIFRSLFSDFSTQASTLEVIFRIICDRIDHVESRLSSMNGFVNELDSRLQNVAHNIEGTEIDNIGLRFQLAVQQPIESKAAKERIAAGSTSFVSNVTQALSALALPENTKANANLDTSKNVPFDSKSKQPMQPDSRNSQSYTSAMTKNTKIKSDRVLEEGSLATNYQEEINPGNDCSKETLKAPLACSNLSEGIHAIGIDKLDQSELSALDPARNCSEQYTTDKCEPSIHGENTIDSQESTEDRELYDESSARLQNELPKIEQTINSSSKDIPVEEKSPTQSFAKRNWHVAGKRVVSINKMAKKSILTTKKNNSFTIASRLAKVERLIEDLLLSSRECCDELKRKVDKRFQTDCLQRMEALEGFTVNNTEDITRLESQKVEKSEFLKSLTKLNDELFGQSCQIQDVKLENKKSRETFTKQLEAFKNFCQVAATNNQKRIEEISTGKSTDERMLSRLKRAISSKADIKDLKALESKFIDGIVTDGDDCVIRCLSCHREVREKVPEQAELETEKRSGNGKVGPEPKRKPKVYSSMVPLRAAPIISQKHQDSSLNTVNEKANDSGRVEVTSSFSIVNTSEHDLQVTPPPTSTENDATNSLTLTPNVKGKKKLKSPEVQFY